MNRIGDFAFWKKLLLLGVAAFVFGFILTGCRNENEPQKWPQLASYEAMRIPPDNPLTAAKVELGKQLFYDTRMSGDGSLSCTSCHKPEYGLTAGQDQPSRAYGLKLGLSCPTLWNVGYQQEFGWEGSGKSLEGMAKGVWQYSLAMGGEGRASMGDICAALNAIEGYRSQFHTVFGEDATPDNVSKALAAFLRTFVADKSAWVRFSQGDQSALSQQARRGYEIFNGKAACTNCHAGILITDLQYHNIGIGMQDERPHPGRFIATKNEKDRGAFKTPTLLNISRSAPYFHNGSVATLEEAVDLMLAGGIDNPNLDRVNLQPKQLSVEERQALLAFLRELNVDYAIEPPVLPK